MHRRKIFRSPEKSFVIVRIGQFAWRSICEMQGRAASCFAISRWRHRMIMRDRSMRNFAFALVLGLSTLTASFGAVQAQEAKQDFQLTNKTGYEIKEVFVSPNKAEDWQEDVLGKDTFADGDTWEIKFHRATPGCNWDLKVVYTVDSSSAVWYGIDLCKVEKITIKYDKASDTTSASFQ
jgi:hypothetical protein